MLTLARNAKGEKGGAKWKSDAKYRAIHFSFFAFHDCYCAFCDKCIAGLTAVQPNHSLRLKCEEPSAWNTLIYCCVLVELNVGPYVGTTWYPTFGYHKCLTSNSANLLVDVGIQKLVKV